MPQVGPDLDDTPLEFGKHRGKTPNEILDTDPNYLIWLYEKQGGHHLSRGLYNDACQSQDINSEFANDRDDMSFE